MREVLPINAGCFCNFISCCIAAKRLVVMQLKIAFKMISIVLLIKIKTEAQAHGFFYFFIDLELSRKCIQQNTVPIKNNCFNAVVNQFFISFRSLLPLLFFNLPPGALNKVDINRISRFSILAAQTQTFSIRTILRKKYMRVP